MRSLRFLALAPLLAFAACGDDTAGPATPFNSALSDDTVVSGLDNAGHTALCNEVASWYSTQVTAAMNKRLTCYSFALVFTQGNSSACNQFANQCMAGDDEGLEVSGDVTCDSQRLNDCQATVGELEACFTETATRLRQVATSLSCSTNPQTLSGLDTPVAACEPLKAKCPGLFDDEDPEL